MSIVDDELARFLRSYPDSRASYERDPVPPRVVRRLRGDFGIVGTFRPGGFDSGLVATEIGQFWQDWRLLFDPSTDPAEATLHAFNVSSVSANAATVHAGQYKQYGGRDVDVVGARLTARIAARPPEKDGTIRWQHDGIDNTLVADTSINAVATVLTLAEAKAAACLAVFGRRDLSAMTPTLIERGFADVTGSQWCWRITVPAQPKIRGGSWARGAVIYWPDDDRATRPLHIEPDGTFASVPLAGNNGVYSGNCTLQVTRVGGEFELVDDALVARGGPVIRTGRLKPIDQLVVTPGSPVTPLRSATNWQNDGSRSAVNPGVGADAHAYAHAAVEYFLGLRDLAGIPPTQAILPDPLHVAVSASPAAQPGEWRESITAAVVANPDWNLPPSWMKRWDFCCSDDVLAHEIAHGVMRRRCTFDYRLESGALEEALADLFAVLATSDAELFERAWMRESTAIVTTVDWLRSAEWRGALPRVPLTPNDRVERGDYPNHYAHFARLAASAVKATQRSKPRNDHGFIHWNSAILTRALAMLAQTAGTLITNPETGLRAIALGRDAVGEVVFYAIQTLGGAAFENIDGTETGFAAFRRILLDAATSSQFDDTVGNVDRRLFAAQIVNVLNATGIGPILSIRGRPVGVRPDLMPSPPAAPPVVIRQGTRGVVWNYGDPQPVVLQRGQDVTIEAKAMNLGVSDQPANLAGSVLLEFSRQANPPRSFDTHGSYPLAPTTPPLARGQRHDFAPVTIPSADLQIALGDPWLAVAVSDKYNQIRTLSTLRAAAADPNYELPLGAVLIRLNLT